MFKKAAGTMLATLAVADINEDYHAMLHGEDMLTGFQIEPMWEQFKAEYAHLSPIDLSDEAAMFDFFANVDSIITHNSRTDKTFTRGINQYSAMTFEDFADHFHLAENEENAPQNCSATRSSPLTEEGNGDAPDSWNWCDKGGVSPVKD